MELSTQGLSTTERDTVATNRNIPITVTVNVPTKNGTEEIRDRGNPNADHNSTKQLEPDFQDCFCNLSKANESHLSKIEEKVPVVCVPRFLLDGRIVIIFSDACQAVLKIWGSYSNLQRLLKKNGIETHRFSQLELRKLKNIGAVDIQVKQCSFIAEEDYRQLLIKNDENSNTDNAKFIQFSNPVNISDYRSTTDLQGVQCEKKHVVHADESGPSQNIISSSSYRVHAYTIENQELVALSEVNHLFEMHFERPELLIQVLLNLEVVVHMFTAFKLERVEIPTAITDGNFPRLCIKRKDFDRVLQYTTALLNKNPPNITWVYLGESNFSCTAEALQGSNSVAGHGYSMTVESSHKPGNCIENVALVTSLNTCQRANVADACSTNSPSGLGKEVVVRTDGCHDSSGVLQFMPQTESLLTSQVASTSGNRYVIRTCRVNDEVVVCIPDLQKAVIDIYGQCVQVGSYMHRLCIPTQRFPRVLLKRLKAHNILSSRATLCTYITKTDAERLLQMYNTHCDNTDDILQNIEWSEPINLEDAVNGDNERHLVEQISQGTLKIPLFAVNDQIVVSMPDVHKAVQMLNGQSVQLQNTLENLGIIPNISRLYSNSYTAIVKQKHSYNEMDRLKVPSHMKRPSLCTYITKSDVDKLLQFYVTPENEAKLKLIEWQLPIAVESVASSTSSDSISSAEAESVSTENNDDNAADSEMSEDYSISDLYKAFVGDDVESVHSSNEDDDLPKTLFKPSSSSSGITIPVQCAATTSDSRDKVDSPSNQLQANRAMLSNNVLPPMHHRGRHDGDTNQLALNVNQTKQVNNPVDSPSDQLQANRAMLSNNVLPAVHLHGRHDRDINQAALNVNQIEHVDNPSIPQPRTCCPRNSLIVATQADLPNENFSQVMATTGCSSCDVTLSCYKMHPSNITGRSVVTTGASVNSTGASAGRMRQTPSADSTSFADFGKLSGYSFCILLICLNVCICLFLYLSACIVYFCIPVCLFVCLSV